MHVAEEAVTLDVLTGGNYILGVGLVARAAAAAGAELDPAPWADLVFGGEQARS